MSVSKIAHSFEGVTITSEGVHILTNTGHLWPLSSEGSLTCHTYCDTGQPFIIVISEDLVAERLAVELSLPVLTTKVGSTEDQTPISRMLGERFQSLSHHGGTLNLKW